MLHYLYSVSPLAALISTYKADSETLTLIPPRKFLLISIGQEFYGNI